jgi:4-amino-4-deoxy-L-arabinose transferase-like glycosyltransferase
MEKVKVKLVEFLKANYKEIIVITIILLLGAFLRLFRISEYMHFYGDEGRDLIIVRNLLVNGDPILIGPGTSVGNMYLGPLYYYLIAPALFLSNYNPVGPVILVAILATATIYLTYLLSKKWFGIIPAVIASLLTAILPTFIKYSNFSWNPNVLPFFSILSVFLIDRIESKKQSWLLIPAFASFAFVLQSHYMGIFLLPVIFGVWIYKLIKQNTKKGYLLNTLFGIFVFGFLMSPLLIFDIRHNYMNINALMDYLGGLGGSRSYSLLTFFERLIINIKFMVGDILSSTNELVSAIYSFFVIIGAIFLHYYSKSKYQIKILSLWLLMSTLGLTLYGGRIISHYYGFAFMVVPMLIGAILGKISDNKKIIGIIFSALVLSPIIYFSITESNLIYPPNRLVQRAEAVADQINKESYGKEFNIAVLSEGNYEDGYQYFLELRGYPIKEIDPLNYNETVTGQLFVICELIEKDCDPTHSAKAEVANFGWSKIEDKWNVNGVVLYKLVHSR